MKNNKNSILKKVIAVGLIAVVSCVNPLQTISPENSGAVTDTLTGLPTKTSAAERDDKYVGEVRLAVDKKADKARQILEDAGYEVIDQDLNEKAGSFWNDLGDQAVFMGIKRTADEKKAIRDMKTMNMLGKYSYSDLKSRIEESKSQAKATYKKLNTAIIEYADNYKANETAAIEAHELMNLYREDDSGKLIGDLFLDNNSEEQLLKVFAEGNTYSISAIGKDLLYGVEKETDNGKTWLERLCKVTSYSAIVKDYAKGMFGTTNVTGEQKEQVEKAIESDLGDVAQTLLNNWGDIRKVFTDAEDSKQAVEDFAENGDEGINYIEFSGDFANTTAVDFSKYIKYGKKTLYDLFTVSAATFEKNIKNLYPLVYAFSEGQRALADTMSIGDLFQAAFMRLAARDSEKEMKEKQDENNELLSQSEPISVYEGVDRDQFSDNAALTSRTTANMSAAGKENSLTDNVLKKMLIGSAVLTGFGVLAVLNYYMGIKNTNSEIAFWDQIRNNANEFEYVADIDKNSDIYTGYFNAEDKFYAREISSYGERDVAEMQKSLQFWKWATIALAVITAVIAAVQFYRSKKSEFNHEQLPIPDVLVDYDTENEAGRNVTYHVVKWNRDRGDKDRADRADLNGDAAREWLALYTTTDTAMGEPILADSIITKVGDNSVPSDTDNSSYVPLTMFGMMNVQNLVDSNYSYYDEVGGIYLWYQKAVNDAATSDELIDDREDADEAEAEESDQEADEAEAAGAASGAAAETTGSNIGGGKIVLIASAGAVGGFIIGMLCMYFIRRKRSELKKTATNE